MRIDTLGNEQVRVPQQVNTEQQLTRNQQASSQQQYKASSQEHQHQQVIAMTVTEQQLTQLEVYTRALATAEALFAKKGLLSEWHLALAPLAKFPPPLSLTPKSSLDELNDLGHIQATLSCSDLRQYGPNVGLVAAQSYTDTNGTHERQQLMQRLLDVNLEDRSVPDRSVQVPTLSNSSPRSATRSDTTSGIAYSFGIASLSLTGTRIEDDLKIQTSKQKSPCVRELLDSLYNKKVTKASEVGTHQQILSILLGRTALSAAYSEYLQSRGGTLSMPQVTLLSCTTFSPQGMAVPVQSKAVVISTPHVMCIPISVSMLLAALTRATGQDKESFIVSLRTTRSGKHRDWYMVRTRLESAGLLRQRVSVPKLAIGLLQEIAKSAVSDGWIPSVDPLDHDIDRMELDLTLNSKRFRILLKKSIKRNLVMWLPSQLNDLLSSSETIELLKSVGLEWDGARLTNHGSR